MVGNCNVTQRRYWLEYAGSCAAPKHSCGGRCHALAQQQWPEGSISAKYGWPVVAKGDGVTLWFLPYRWMVETTFMSFFFLMTGYTPPRSLRGQYLLVFSHPPDRHKVWAMGIVPKHFWLVT